MGATPSADPTLGTRHPSGIRHLFTVTPKIAEALASTFTLDLHNTVISTPDPNILGIVVPAAPLIQERHLSYQNRPTSLAIAIASSRA